MKIIFLLPPSEWKNSWWGFSQEKTSFKFPKPIDIANNATEKDLKCKAIRYEEGLNLNKNIALWPFEYGIHRYKWVMYNAIDYPNMTNKWKQFFENNFIIISWMYGLVKPLDIIGNYKLPIESKWLYKFWWEEITNAINRLNPDYIVNLLSGSYLKVIKKQKLNWQLINVNFLMEKNWKIVKISHGVKKIKWNWIKKISENWIENYRKFGGEIVENNDNIDINIL